MTRTATLAGWNSGASSTRAIAPGNGYAEFKVAGDNVNWMAGLTRVDLNAGYGTIDFAMRAHANGNAYAVESGVVKASLGAYRAGDVFRVEMLGGRVRYLKNGVVGYEHQVAISYRLVLDSSIYTVGATVSRAVLAGTLVAAP